MENCVRLRGLGGEGGERAKGDKKAEDDDDEDEDEDEEEEDIKLPLSIEEG
jgi:hypothetical protein